MTALNVTNINASCAVVYYAIVETMKICDLFCPILLKDC